MQSREEAQKKFWSLFAQYLTAEESIPSRTACGRVTSAAVIANLSSPSFHSAAMDGLAVFAADTFGAADDTPLALDLESGKAVPINTGHPVPSDKDAVIMIENILMSEDGRQGIIRAPVYPWQHVRKVGEDIVATELLFPTGHKLGPADLGALLTAGCPEVKVRKKPKVRIIPTGSELVELQPGNNPPPAGKTIESNSAVLAAMCEKAGAVVEISPIIEDEYQTIKDHLLDSVHSDADCILINAGSSAGSADYTVQVIDDLGKVVTHGVTMMPGKPTILGVIEDKPVIGNPGYPVSAIMSCEQFILPLLSLMQGLDPEEPLSSKAILAKDMPSRSGMEEFRRMVAGKIGGNIVAVPLKKGAGAITTLTRANAMLHIDAASEGETRGTAVDIELLKSRQQMEKTILCTGSHDLCLDLLHDFLKQNSPSYPLASTHVGSLGGIMALGEAMTHIAGSHLLDPKDGSYNTSYINKYLSGQDIKQVTLVHRQQGFMVKKGNPKKIKDFSSLTAENIIFINRQAGSGTRVLLDYELDRNGIDCDEITGYDHDEYTHMAVAVAVLSGKADAGLGIMSAARALDLDFIPVTEERYELLIPSSYLELPMIQAILTIINSQPFKQAAEQLGGYSTRETGQIR